MRRAILLALLLLLLPSCKDDPVHPANCPDGPDFEVLITALDAPLPADTVISVQYGGGLMDQYRIPDPLGHEVLFCQPSDREGNTLPAGGHGGEGPIEDGSHGLGGAGGGSELQGITCDLWTDGPARLTVETSMYPTRIEELTAKKGKCIVWTEIELAPDDGGA